MKRRTRLAEIAEVRGGYVPSASEGRARKRREDVVSQELPVHGPVGDERAHELGLQPSAILPGGAIDWHDLTTLLPVRGAERYAIRDGDLLLPLRSLRLQSAVARGVPVGVLAAGQWAIICPDPTQVDVQYLAWYMNHPRTRARLAATMMGSSLQFLTVAAVREFDVELPALSTQRRIGRVDLLTTQANQLEQKLGVARRELADALAMFALESRSISRTRDSTTAV